NIGENYLALRQWKDGERAALRALAIDPHDIVAADVLLSARLNSTGDVGSARRTLDGFPEVIKSLNLLERQGANAGGAVTNVINMWPYLDVIERRFADAFQALEKQVLNDDRAHLQQLAGRVVLCMLAGQTVAAKSAGEDAR